MIEATARACVRKILERSSWERVEGTQLGHQLFKEWPISRQPGEPRGHRPARKDLESPTSIVLPKHGERRVEGENRAPVGSLESHQHLLLRQVERSHGSAHRASRVSRVAAV